MTAQTGLGLLVVARGRLYSVIVPFPGYLDIYVIFWCNDSLGLFALPQWCHKWAVSLIVAIPGHFVC